MQINKIFPVNVRQQQKKTNTAVNNNNYNEYLLFPDIYK